jgi:hypothetical protein
MATSGKLNFTVDAALFRNSANDLRRDLERIPPDVDAALTRIRKLLARPRPAA